MSIEKIKELRKITGAGVLDVKKALIESNNDINKAIEWLRINGISKAAKKSDRIAADGSIFISSKENKVAMIEINSETDFVASNEIFNSISQQIANKILEFDLKDNDINTVLSLKINDVKIEDLLIDLTAKIGEKITLRRFCILNGIVSSYKHSNSKIGVIILGKNIEKSTLRDIAMHIAAMSPKFLSMNDISDEKKEKELILVKKELSEILKNKPEKIQKNIIEGKLSKVLAEDVLIEQSFIKDPNKKIKDILGEGELVGFERFEVGEGIEKKVENFAEEVKKQMQK